MSNFPIANLGISSSSLTQAQTDRAVQTLRNKVAGDTPSKIDKAAHDFESILVGQWLEKAEKSFATVPGTDPDQNRDSGRDQFQSIACQYMAQALSKNGSFGIAAMVSKHLAAVDPTPPATDPAPAASGIAFQAGLDASKLKKDK